MAGIVHEVENRDLLAQVRQQAAAAAQELAEAAHLHRGQIVVVGCSTSEVVGKKVGSWSTPEVADAIFAGLHSVFGPMGVYIAAQCCEHLNRGIVVEKAVLKELGLTQVRAIPQPKAGGSVPAAAWKKMEKPALAVSIQADAAIDIGDTLVGMHIRPVAVPLRISTSHVGHANLVMAYSRLPYIGGARAVYTE